MGDKKSVTKETATRYKRGAKKAKRVILDEPCAFAGTGTTREKAIHVERGRGVRVTRRPATVRTGTPAASIRVAIGVAPGRPRQCRRLH